MEKTIINKIIEINEYCLPITKLILKNNTFGIYTTSELFLMNIYSGKVFSASTFSKMHGLSKSYVARLSRQLEKDRLIVRSKHTDDARVMLLSLTPKGKTYTETVIKSKNEELCNKLSLLPEDLQTELINAFNTITDILK